MRIRIALLAAMVVAAPVHAQTSTPDRKTAPVKVPSVDRKPTAIKVQDLGNKVTPKMQHIDPANIKLTFYLIQADGFTNDDADIRQIVTELRKAFKYSGYRLASKSVLQSAMDDIGRSSAKQIVSDPEGVRYEIYAETRALQDGNIVLRVSLQVSNQELIDASISLRDGKTVVLGSAMGGKEEAIILAVTPTIEH